MTKLKWEKTEGMMGGFRHRAIYERTFSLDYKKFGKRVWGSGKLETGIQWIFAISSRNTVTEEEPSPYQLLIGGLSGINGHVYVSNVDEGKKIAQEICDYFIKEMRKIK